MLESIWIKSKWGEGDSASALPRCGASKIEISWTPPTPMPVCFLNSAMTGCIGTKYGDQIIPLTSAAPAGLAAGAGGASLAAARASGVVPGMRFATVSPTPPSMNLRREIFDLVMAFLPPVFSFGSYGRGLFAASRPRKQLASPPEIFMCRPLIELIVCGEVAIRNTVRPAHDNWSRGHENR